MNLTWTEAFDSNGVTYRASEVGAYRFVIEDDSATYPRTPFTGTIEMTSGHAYGSGSATVEIGHYKSLSSAKAGLKRRAAKYGI
jgi:hypothetical protein